MSYTPMQPKPDTTQVVFFRHKPIPTTPNTSTVPIPTLGSSGTLHPLATDGYRPTNELKIPKNNDT